MHPRFEVRPPFLCRRLFSPSAFRCRCRDGWLLLDTKEGEKAIRMEAVTETLWREFWLVGPLALTAEAGAAARPIPASAAPPSRRIAPFGVTAWRPSCLGGKGRGGPRPPIPGHRSAPWHLGPRR
jgi:hypothetical protein